MPERKFKEGQEIWYCKPFELIQVKYMENIYGNREREALIRMPSNMKCFAAFQELYTTQVEALDAMITKAEEIRGVITQKLGLDCAANTPISNDDEAKNTNLLHLISDLYVRVAKLEKIVKLK